MSTRDFDALGFDPAPGEPEKITALADRYRRVAESLGEAHEALSRIGNSDGLWQGKAAEAFRGTVNDLPDLLDRGQRSLRAAGEALHGWQADLEVMQRQAAELESRAEAAKKRAERAERNPDLGLAGQEFPDE